MVAETTIATDSNSITIVFLVAITIITGIYIYKKQYIAILYIKRSNHGRQRVERRFMRTCVLTLRSQFQSQAPNRAITLTRVMPALWVQSSLNPGWLASQAYADGAIVEFVAYDGRATAQGRALASVTGTRSQGEHGTWLAVQIRCNAWKRPAF